MLVLVMLLMVMLVMLVMPAGGYAAGCGAGSDAAAVDDDDDDDAAAAAVGDAVMVTLLMLMLMPMLMVLVMLMLAVPVPDSPAPARRAAQVSVHPLMQHIPLRVLKARVAKGQHGHIPFATVVTDFTTCHNTWFHKGEAAAAAAVAALACWLYGRLLVTQLSSGGGAGRAAWSLGIACRAACGDRCRPAAAAAAAPSCRRGQVLCGDRVRQEAGAGHGAGGAADGGAR
jgi:hypothetical protein